MSDLLRQQKRGKVCAESRGAGIGALSSGVCVLARRSTRIIKSENHEGWKGPLRSSGHGAGVGDGRQRWPLPVTLVPRAICGVPAGFWMAVQNGKGRKNKTHPK